MNRRIFGMLNPKGVSATALILVLLLLLVLAGVSFFVYKQKQEQSLPQTTTFDNVDLNEEVVIFLFQRIPSLYRRVAQLNNELALIAAELERIDELEAAYPSGKRIIGTERTLWIKLQKDLNVMVQSTRSSVESYYVAYMVNNEKGKELISEDVTDLIADIDKVLVASNEETRRLKTVSSQTFMEKLKGLF